MNGNDLCRVRIGREGGRGEVGDGGWGGGGGGMTRGHRTDQVWHNHSIFKPGILQRRNFLCECLTGESKVEATSVAADSAEGDEGVRYGQVLEAWVAAYHARFSEAEQYREK